MELDHLAIPISALAADAAGLEPSEFAAKHGSSFLLCMPTDMRTSEAGSLAETMVSAGPGGFHPSNVAGFLVYPLFPQLTGGNLVIGRDPTCDVIIDDVSVSSMHCCMVREGTAAVHAYDGDSTNGTHVNGVEAPKLGTSEGTPLTPMSRVRLGTFEATFVEADQLRMLAKRLFA